MYCNNCGAQNNDDAVFCIECGESLAAEVVDYIDSEEDYVLPKRKPRPKNRSVKLVALAAAVLAGLILLCSLLFGSSWKKTSKSFVQNALKGNFVKLSSYYPSNIVHYDINKNYDDKKRAFNDALKTEGKTVIDSIKKDGTQFSNVRIVGYKDFDTKNIEDYANLVKIAIDLKLSVKDIKYVYVRFDSTVGKDTDSNDLTLILGKVDGKWRVLPNGYRAFNSEAIILDSIQAIRNGW